MFHGQTLQASDYRQGTEICVVQSSENIRPPADGRPERSDLLSVEGADLCLVATAATRGFPVHLDQPVMAAQGLIVAGVANGSGSRSPLPRALVGILTTAAVIPRVEIGIRTGFFGFVRHNRGHAIGSAVIVRALGLR